MRFKPLFISLIFLSVILWAGEEPENLFDAGTVIQGKVIEHTFILKNDLDQPLKIENIKADCGCTTTDYPKEIPSKGEGKIKVRIDTAFLPVAEQAKRIHVITNHPEHKVFTYMIKLKVDSPIVFVPARKLAFNKARTEVQTKEARVFTTNQEVPFDISFENVPSWITLRKSLMPEDQKSKDPNFNEKQYFVEISVTDKAPLGYQEVPITMKTNLPEQPYLPLELIVFVRDDILITPPKFEFKDVPAGHPTRAKRRFHVIDFTGKYELEVEKITSDIPFLTFEIFKLTQMMGPATRYFCLMRIPPTAPLGPFEGKIYVHTNQKDPKYKVLTAEVKGNITSKWEGKEVPRGKAGVGGFVPPKEPNPKKQP